MTQALKLPMVQQLRLTAITKVMAELEAIRWWYGKSDAELQKFGFYKYGLEIGECDQISELHRLLYYEFLEG